MVVVRESPRTQRSPDTNNTQWPPKSPFQALLSSPSGRKKWEDRRNWTSERTPSPSPIRRQAHETQMPELGADTSDEEDEETLRLRLQQIEARLKLKELQKQKNNKSEVDKSGNEGVRGDRAERRRNLERNSRTDQQPTFKRQIEVPVSPPRQNHQVTEQLSPARARLGLTSTARAEGVSLKRARDGSQIKRSETLRATLRAKPEGDMSRPKSFNKRLEETRAMTEFRQARTDRLEQIRSASFAHMSRKSMSKEATQATASRKELPKGQQDFTGRLANGSTSSRSVQYQERAIAAESNASLSSTNGLSTRSRSRLPPLNNDVENAESSKDRTLGNKTLAADVEDGDGVPGYDPFSDIHLSKRHIAHSVVSREMAGKEIYPLSRLLKEVKSPNYEPPACECDYVVFAVLASKSDPFDQAQTHRTVDKGAQDNLDAPRNKFMVLRLCDLKWDIDCYLFGTAFTQFWKLTPGTLLAILNPAILPPKGNQHNGRFSLKLGSSEDCVMEIGVARDLGCCSSIKKDGKQCEEWIDKRKTEACEFHISLLVNKQRKDRMEVNTMWHGNKDADDQNSRRVHAGKQGQKPTRSKARTYHPEYGWVYAYDTGAKAGKGMSAASLLDAEDTDALHNMTQDELSRKRLAESQKERDLAKQLAEMGNGMGAEYLRASHAGNAGSSSVRSAGGGGAAAETRSALFAKPSASELGLLGNKASDAHLSPAKDRRRHFGLGALALSATTAGSGRAVGWGGARRAGLLQPRQDGRLGSPEKGQTRLEVERARPKSLTRPRSQQSSSIRSAGSTSPLKKRARFALANGIREPGRESLPGEGLLAATKGNATDDGSKTNERDERNNDDGNDDDDDDELDIV